MLATFKSGNILSKRLYQLEDTFEHENLVRENAPTSPEDNYRRRKGLLSRDCDGCSQMRPCGKRYYIAEKGDKVYCPDGTAHLVDGN